MLTVPSNGCPESIRLSRSLSHCLYLLFSLYTFNYLPNPSITATDVARVFELMCQFKVASAKPITVDRRDLRASSLLKFASLLLHFYY